MAALKMFNAFCEVVRWGTFGESPGRSATHVEVNDLRQERANNKDKQDVEEPVVKLRLAADGRHDGGTQTLCGDDAEPTDPAANGDVDEHIFLAVLGRDEEGRQGSTDKNDTCVAQETGLYDIMLHLLDIGDRRLLGRIHDDDDGANDAQKTSDLADHTQALFQEDGRADGANDDGQGAQGGDEDGVGEGVGDKVEDFAEDHQDHAGPPKGIFQVAITLASGFIVFFVGLEQADFF